MCVQVNYKYRHQGDFQIFICGRRNWQKTEGRVSVLDAQFFANNISVSRLTFHNRLDDGTSYILSFALFSAIGKSKENMNLRANEENISNVAQR